MFVLSGPSGSGKTTLLKTVLQRKALASNLVKSTSFTTRPQRQGEENREDYFFISQDKFKQQLKAKKFLEWTKYLGYYYGTPKGFIDRQLKKSRHIILCVDLNGAAKIKQLYPKNTVTIFVLPPSLKELETRIAKRCDKTHRQEIKKRLALAEKELLAAPGYDYRIVNKDLSTVVGKLEKIILQGIFA